LLAFGHVKARHELEAAGQAVLSHGWDALWNRASGWSGHAIAK